MRSRRRGWWDRNTNGLSETDLIEYLGKSVVKVTLNMGPIPVQTEVAFLKNHMFVICIRLRMTFKWLWQKWPKSKIFFLVICDSDLFFWHKKRKSAFIQNRPGPLSSRMQVK